MGLGEILVSVAIITSWGPGSSTPGAPSWSEAAWGWRGVSRHRSPDRCHAAALTQDVRLVLTSHSSRPEHRGRTPVAREYSISGGEIDADHLARQASVMGQASPRFLLRAGLGEESTCLDRGCGQGHVAIAMAQVVDPAVTARAGDLDEVAERTANPNVLGRREGVPGRAHLEHGAGHRGGGRGDDRDIDAVVAGLRAAAQEETVSHQQRCTNKGSTPPARQSSSADRLTRRARPAQ